MDLFIADTQTSSLTTPEKWAHWHMSPLTLWGARGNFKFYCDYHVWLKWNQGCGCDIYEGLQMILTL